jgi:hypothetical protein
MTIAGCSTQMTKSNMSKANTDSATINQIQDKSDNISNPSKPDTSSFESSSPNVISSQDSSSDVNPNDEPQIINNVSNELKLKFSDINITNEWVGELTGNNRRSAVIFGSLKKDPQQGVAVNIGYANNKIDGSVTRFLCPQRNGAVKVIADGSKPCNMVVIDENKHQWNFNISNGGFVIMMS